MNVFFFGGDRNRLTKHGLCLLESDFYSGIDFIWSV